MAEPHTDPLAHTDPINGSRMYIKSICYPTQSLLQGMPYNRDNYILTPATYHPPLYFLLPR